MQRALGGRLERLERSCLRGGPARRHDKIRRILKQLPGELEADAAGGAGRLSSASTRTNALC